MLKQSLIAGLGLVLSAASSWAAEDALHLSVVSALPKNHVALKIFRERFQSEVERRMAEAEAGTVVWDETHAGTLARYGGVLEAVEDDLALFGIVSVNHETKRLPLQNLTFRTPFTTESCVTVGSAYHAIRQTLDGMTAPFAAARQTYLAALASYGYDFIATQKIRNAADMRGVPMAVTDRIEDWIAGVDGAPVRLQAKLLNARLEDGALVGALLPTTEMQRLGLKRHADHFTRTGFGAQVPFVVTVNTKAFDALPAALHEAVRETVSDFVPAAAEDYCAAGLAALEKLKTQGIRTAKLLKSRREQWSSVLPPMAQAWARRNDQAGRPGSQAVAAYMNHLEVAGARVMRDWSLPAPKGALEKLVPTMTEVSRAPAN